MPVTISRSRHHEEEPTPCLQDVLRFFLQGFGG
jgi:hypothetical protein